ncbi:ectonucleotide pyrophosphatase/phosphodiesterase [soil metagenome]
MGACWRGVILGMTLTACASATPPAAAAPQGVDRGALSGSGGINTPAQRDKPYLILISLDGFKAEYLDRFDLPHLRRLTQRGARSKGMVPVFPSLTFPNHYSLVTGLHPGRHGLVSNRFYDPARKDTYVFTDPRTVTDGSWYGGEPIWVTAESQGMVTACFFWPGSEAEIKGVRPTTYNKYTSGVTNDARVKTVLEWLRLPIEQRPHLITLYFSELDEASHIGPLESPQVLTAALSLDAAIGALVAGIDASPVRDQTYLVITSDHGMVNTSDAQTVRLASLLDPDQIAGIEASFGGPVASIHLEEGAGNAPGIRDRINRQLARGTAYLRAELPERFHYRDNPRAGDVIVVMDESWTMSTPRPAAPPQAPDAAGETTKPPGPERAPRERWGQHGWDNQLPSMRALFLITGPGVRAGAIVDDVRNVDVYPMMTELLGLRPAADIDGEIGRITRFIK